MDLKELLGEELYKQISEKLGDKKLAIVSDGNWFPKEKFDEVNEQKKLYKQQADDLNRQLEEMGKTAKGNEDLKKQLETMQNQLKEADGKVKDISLTSAVKLAAIKANAKDVDVVSLLVDKSKLNIKEDGSIDGLDEQFKTLTESKAFLFGEMTPPNPGANPGGNGGAKDPSTMSMEEYKNYRKNGGK